jgi:hypothetical protein
MPWPSVVVAGGMAGADMAEEAAVVVEEEVVVAPLCTVAAEAVVAHR